MTFLAHEIEGKAVRFDDDEVRNNLAAVFAILGAGKIAKAHDQRGTTGKILADTLGVSTEMVGESLELLKKGKLVQVDYTPSTGDVTSVRDASK
jgi:hypothetical protein